MSNVKQEPTILTLSGRDYPLVLTFNVIDQLQEKYGSIDDALQKSEKIGVLTNIIWMLVAESAEIHNDNNPNDVWEIPTERKVGRMLNLGNVDEVNAALLAVFKLSLPSADDGGAEKNAVTA